MAITQKWGEQSQLTRDWVKRLAGVSADAPKKKVINRMDPYLDYELNKKGKRKLETGMLNSAGEDLAYQGLVDLFNGTAERSQRLGTSNPTQNQFLGQFLPGFTFEAFAGYNDSQEDKWKQNAGIAGQPFQMNNGVPGAWRWNDQAPGYYNITAAKQNIDKIRRFFGDNVANRFETWVDAEMEKASPKRKFEDSLPQLQKDILARNAVQQTAAPGANWAGLNNFSNPANYGGYTPPQQMPQPMLPPQFQGGLFGSVQAPPTPQTNLQQQILSAGLIGAGQGGR